MLTPEQLADLRAKAEAATPGPWHSNYDPENNMLEGKNCEWVMGLDLHAGCPFIYDGISDDQADALVAAFPCTSRVDISTKDLDYIAAANPATVLQLLEMVERLEKEADWLGKILANVCNGQDMPCFSDSCPITVESCDGCSQRDWHAAARMAVESAE